MKVTDEQLEVFKETYFREADEIVSIRTDAMRAALQAVFDMAPPLLELDPHHQADK